MEISYTNQTDLLIIGGGGAGIKAAIKAGEQRVKVLLVTKYRFGRTGASFYPGMSGWGINAITHEGDSEEHFYDEILAAGAGAVDKKLARVLVEQCTRRFREMEEYGVEFGKNEKGEYNSVVSCFGKRVRGAGAELGMIKKALWKQLMKNRVAIRSGVSIVSLIVEDGVCRGALGFDEMDGLMAIQAKAVILAAGGGCDLYRYSLAMPDQTGDGYLMALDAGAKLVNMEFLQFIPGLTWPERKLLFQEKNLDTLPSITDRRGEEVLPKYLPPGVSKADCLRERAKNGPFTSADISKYFDIALYEEWRKGGVRESGGIHFQYHPSVLDDQRWFIKEWREWMASRGVDVVNRGFDIIPHAQCFNGGVHINTDAGTGVPGLYAAGENAGGAHGADRLGGNAQAATQVFGAIAGEEAAKYALSVSSGGGFPQFRDEKLLEILEKRFRNPAGKAVDLDKAIIRAKEIMWDSGAVVRSEKGLRRGLEEIRALMESFDPWAHFLERGSEKSGEPKKAAGLFSRLKLSNILLEIMQFRRESRGPHYRSDFPGKELAYEGMIQAAPRSGKTEYALIKGEKLT